MLPIGINIIDKTGIGTGLNFDQTRHIDDGIDLAKVFSYTFFARIRFLHFANILYLGYISATIPPFVS
jgi:hypothetical protein